LMELLEEPRPRSARGGDSTRKVVLTGKSGKTSVGDQKSKATKKQQRRWVRG